MNEAVITPLFDTLIEYLAERASPEEILAFALPEEQEARAKALLQREAEGILSEAETVELEQMMHFDHLVTHLKARASREFPGKPAWRQRAAFLTPDGLSLLR